MQCLVALGGEGAGEGGSGRMVQGQAGRIRVHVPLAQAFLAVGLGRIAPSCVQGTGPRVVFRSAGQVVSAISGSEVWRRTRAPVSEALQQGSHQGGFRVAGEASDPVSTMASGAAALCSSTLPGGARGRW